MFRGPIALSSSRPGCRTSTEVPARRSVASSASRRSGAAHPHGASRLRIASPHDDDIGDSTTTRSRSSSAARSALVGECTAPSTWRTPSMTTGRKKPGMAQDASTAVPTSTSRVSLPKTTRARCPCAPRTPRTSARAIRCRAAPGPGHRGGRWGSGRWGGARRRPGRAGAARVGPARGRRDGATPARTRASSAAPLSRPEITRRRAMESGLAGAVRRWASASSTWTPPRRMAPKLDAAEVPMITSAVRGSHRSPCSRAESAPEW